MSITRFRHSGEGCEDFILGVYDRIEQDGMHSILAFDLEIQWADEGYRGLESIAQGHWRYGYFLTHDKSDVSSRCIFPEPGALLALCLQMGIHPAYIYPQKKEAPTPRSILMLCKSISMDSDYPEYDQLLAADSLACEWASIRSFQERHPELWRYLEQKNFIVAQSVDEIADLEWSGQHPKLAGLFAACGSMKAKDLSLFPLAPDSLFCREARIWDRDAVRYLETALGGLHAKRKEALQSLEELGEEIFGRGRTETVYQAMCELMKARKCSPLAFRGRLKINYTTFNPSFDIKRTGFRDEEQLSCEWLKRCAVFYEADSVFQREKKDLSAKIREFQEAYHPTRFSRDDFNAGLAFYENNEGMCTPHDMPEHLGVIRTNFEF